MEISTCPSFYEEEEEGPSLQQQQTNTSRGSLPLTEKTFGTKTGRGRARGIQRNTTLGKGLKPRTKNKPKSEAPAVKGISPDFFSDIIGQVGVEEPTRHVGKGHGGNKRRGIGSVNNLTIYKEGGEGKK